FGKRHRCELPSDMTKRTSGRSRRGDWMQLWECSEDGVCKVRFKGTARSNGEKSDVLNKKYFSAAENAEKFVADFNSKTGMARVPDSNHWIFSARKNFATVSDGLSAA